MKCLYLSLQLCLNSLDDDEVDDEFIVESLNYKSPYQKYVKQFPL